MKKKICIAAAAGLAAALLIFLICLASWHITGISTPEKIVLLREDDTRSSYCLTDDIIYSGNPPAFWKKIVRAIYGISYTCDSVASVSDGTIRAEDVEKSCVEFPVHIASGNPILNKIQADTSFSVYSLMLSIESEDITLSVLEPEQKVTIVTAPSDCYKKSGFDIVSEDESVVRVEGMQAVMVGPGDSGLIITSRDFPEMSVSIQVHVMSSTGEIKLEKLKDMLPGATAQAKVTTDVENAEIGTEFTYSSSNGEVATIDSNGVITARAGGYTVITVKNELNQMAEQKLHVKSVPSKLSAADMTLTEGEQSKAVVETDVKDPEAGTTYTFASGNTEVATVDADGTVHAVQSGETDITITNEYKLTASFHVTVEAAGNTIVDGTDTLGTGSGTTAQTSLGEYIGIIGHMGYSAKYTGNSKDAFEQGAKAGMIGLECDLNMSGSELVCYHVGKSASDGCSFATYLDICKEYGCIGIADLQTSDSDCYTKAYKMISDRGLLDQIVLQTSSVDLMKTISKKYDGALKMWYLNRHTLTASDISSVSGIKGVVGINANAWTHSGGKSVEDSGNRSKATIDKVHSAGLTYCVYSLDDSGDRKQVKNAGIDYIMSNTH